MERSELALGSIEARRTSFPTVLRLALCAESTKSFSSFVRVVTTLLTASLYTRSKQDGNEAKHRIASKVTGPRKQPHGPLALRGRPLADDGPLCLPVWLPGLELLMSVANDFVDPGEGRRIP